MSGNGVTARLRRRWPLTMTGLVLTAGLSLAMAMLVGPTYQATARVVLLPPAANVTTGAVTNPYLSLAGLRQVVDVLTRVLSGQDMTAEVSTLVPGATFTATADFTSSAPILLITAAAPTGQGTLAVLTALTDQVPTTLQHLQASQAVAAPAQITAKVLGQDTTPQSVQKTRLRLVITAAAAGSALTVAAVWLLDEALTRRYRPRSEPDGAANPDLPAAARRPQAPGPAPRRKGLRAPPPPTG